MNTPEHDEIVERVLRQIGTAAPPAGMERRILAAVEERVAARSSTRHVWLGWPLPLIYGGALAGVSALVFSVSTVQRSAPSTKVAVTRLAAKPEILLAAAAPPRLAHEGRTPHQPVPRAGRFSQVEAATGGVMLPASYPAPPMPLTEQEKLLLRVVHKGDPEELAMLEPEVRAKLEARSAAEFQTFFASPLVEQNQQNP